MAQNKTQNYLRHEKFAVKLQKLRLNKDESCKIGEFKRTQNENDFEKQQLV